MGKRTHGLSPAGLTVAGNRGQYARIDPRREHIRANEEVVLRHRNRAAGVVGRFARRHMFRKKCIKKCKKRCNASH